MALGRVAVHNLNQGQGDIKAIERHVLFVGRAAGEGEQSQLFSVGAQTDLNAVLQDSTLRQQVKAAQLNAGQNWTAAVYPMAADETLAEAIEHANAAQSFEMVVVCIEMTQPTELNDIHALMVSQQASRGRFMCALVAVPGIDEQTQSWPEYEAACTTLQNNLAAHLVVAVPQLHGNNLGVLAGRLCDHSVSIADSPMRVETGSVRGLGEPPKDKNGAVLSLATLNTLATSRFSVPQTYADFEGTYWSNAQTLDAIGGDYQYLEHLRAVHKASREVRVLAIRRVANRALNSTPASIEMNKTYFMRPLRAMSKSVKINGVVFPGDITPPKEGDISITWPTNKKVAIYMVVRPYNSPKDISVNIMLDLSNE
ncbi:DUF2586 domain-containing protein [Pseudoalteromonas obscura]|uniref:DUF2586 domain-containing protein n=1 Tax=Pseudoalteromonas obscura TaxID=3048491 RepID=A0ABT7ES77_9GAMM|nr:DUF2586 domain-containing protein [Pseudoalteromonas sp. P94(2023)]MDK2597904.1 DUF2586 domain-containing protein [Pseudoalteromonas sp. P94(2023)]